MVLIPTLCLACGEFSPSAIDIVDSVLNIEGAVTGSCPFCGGVTQIPRGVYRDTQDVIGYLIGSGTTPADLARLRRLVEKARSMNMSPSGLAEQIANDIPSLTGLADTLRKKGLDLWMMLLALIAAIIPILQETKKDPTPNVSVTINQVFERLNAESKKKLGTKETKSTPFRRKEPKIRRNAPCPCKSGKKYKICHGKISP